MSSVRSWKLLKKVVPITSAAVCELVLSSIVAPPVGKKMCVLSAPPCLRVKREMRIKTEPQMLLLS